MDQLLQKINFKDYINELSWRKDITWDFILEHIDAGWHDMDISRIAPLEWLDQHPNRIWFSVVSSRMTDIDMIRKYTKDLNWGEVSANVDIQTVLDNPDLPWDYKVVSRNPKVDIDIVNDNPQIEWSYFWLTLHMDLGVIYANPDCKWSYDILAERVNLDFIRQYPEKFYEYRSMSQNPNLTIEFLLENTDKRWNWHSVIENPNLKVEDLVKNNIHLKEFKTFQRTYPDYCVEHQELLPELDWLILSHYVKLETLKKYPNKPWHMSINKNMTMEYVLKHPKRGWSFVELSKKNQITLQDVLNHWDLPWNISEVIRNKY